jgi:DNA-nicking Smr family endonuclease
MLYKLVTYGVVRSVKAAAAIFRKHNSEHSVRVLGVVDLHGLHVAECKELLSQLLRQLHEEGERRTLDVITGTGHHSKGGTTGKV